MGWGHKQHTAGQHNTHTPVNSQNQMSNTMNKQCTHILFGPLGPVQNPPTHHPPPNNHHLAAGRIKVAGSKQEGKGTGSGGKGGGGRKGMCIQGCGKAGMGVKGEGQGAGKGRHMYRW